MSAIYVPRCLLVVCLTWSTVRASQPEPMIPTTTAPIIYTINYRADFFTDPDYAKKFKAVPPDLLHIGKAVPISHHWGPTGMYYGENQWTGGPKHTLSRKNIALLSPEQLSERIEHLRKTVERYHAMGVREITPYISYHTVAGDHEEREGFWTFYDRWDEYSRWAGPRPGSDPIEWMVQDRSGAFQQKVRGGYPFSPDYFAPLHRYNVNANHPDWIEWQRRLVRMVAEVGYDGCFVDNSMTLCSYDRHSQARFRRFLDQNRNTPWVQRFTKGLDFDKLTLLSPEIPSELVRRWQSLCTGEHLGMLQEHGRKIKPGFTIFPNSGRLDGCLAVGGRCDRLMFEYSFAPGIRTESQLDEPRAVSLVVSEEPVRPKRITRHFDLKDRATFMEVDADIVLPATAQVGQPAPFELTIHGIGESPGDADAAEDFGLLLKEIESGVSCRVEFEPRGAVGGSGSRKPTCPPVTLKGSWTPTKPGRYVLHFGFRYTDDDHAKTTTLRPHQSFLHRERVCHNHLAELLFTQHMRARCIYLAMPECRMGGKHLQELALAEMAAFSGGGGVSAEPIPTASQGKYRTFFQNHPELFAGWRPYAPAAVLCAYWGPNPLRVRHYPYPHYVVHDWLGETHRPFVVLLDTRLPDLGDDLSAFRVVYLQSPHYEMSPVQIQALRDYVLGGGVLVVTDASIEINSRPIGEYFSLEGNGPVAASGLPRATLWSWHRPTAPTSPLAGGDSGRGNLRFAMYRRDDRLAVHVVNYNVSLSEKNRRVLDVEPTPLEIPLPPGWTSATAGSFDPDAEPQTLPCSVEANVARLTMPKTHLYQIVLLKKR